MTLRALRVRIPCAPDRLMQLLSNQAGFPAHSPDILSVTPSGDGHSTWQLAFRGARVNWTQRDEVRADGFAFTQTEGDFIALRGAWSVVAADGDKSAAAASEVSYEVDFRTSVAHLAGAVDPVVGRVLLRSALAVLTGLAEGPVDVLAGGEFLHDLPDLTVLR